MLGGFFLNFMGCTSHLKQEQYVQMDPYSPLGGGFKYFFFHPYLGKIPILTNIFHMG